MLLRNIINSFGTACGPALGGKPTLIPSSLSPERDCTPKWAITLLKPQSRFGDISLRIRIDCPLIGTAVY